MIPAIQNSVETMLLRRWEATRPESLREFDQIPMVGTDLVESVKVAARRLADRRVVFMGDHDGVSVLIGMFASRGLVPAPKRMHLLDFDERLLDRARLIATEYGFSHLLNAELYNVFDMVPAHLIGAFDAYYTNPPYGMSNDGESVRLFMARAMEMANAPGSLGQVVLPCDPQRPWTQNAAARTTQFAEAYSWDAIEMLCERHGYHLDDDPQLRSALLTLHARGGNRLPLPWQGRDVPHQEIPYFYGRSVAPPYPRYILSDGQRVQSTQVAS
ncbi:bis-aminopropyl spermidine synthase family protein [Deinococcus sp. HMF7604]|uniref:bis-aminopropyl spermidine synthase family protein n=1 Tax=Deinococcus betulae TaxID=2873312 RepID=UPI001CCCB5AF|nr:bis-aminopropyl spermidine synthase family protein [Deinococcus betulae]MBZ9752817.1 bis-aminopropyl spermidine synthase family protein [Deinococcus betulae]